MNRFNVIQNIFQSRPRQQEKLQKQPIAKGRPLRMISLTMRYSQIKSRPDDQGTRSSARSNGGRTRDLYSVKSFCSTALSYMTKTFLLSVKYYSIYYVQDKEIIDIPT